jgi:lauroyl/myristoyl acyltransferase
LRLKFSSFLQWRFNIFFCLKLGWKFSLSYVIILGKLYFCINKKEKNSIKEALKRVFEDRRDETEIEDITEKVFRGIFFHYYEKLFNAFSSDETLKAFLRNNVESEDLVEINQGLLKGKGVLFITGHYGGVEFLPAYLATNNYPVTIIARFASNRLREMSIQKAERFSTKIIDPDHTPNIMRAICDSLKENRIVITQCDEIDEWRPSRRNKTVFLRNQIHLDRTIDILMKRVDASSIFGIMHRDNEYRYKFIAFSWEKMKKQAQQSINGSPGAVVLKLLEQYIYRYPEEWYLWKKYSMMESPLPYGMKVETKPSFSFLKPSLSKIS